MSKYIDADRLLAFLQKKLESYKSKIVDPSKFPVDHIDLMALLAREYQALIIQIDSLQQKMWKPSKEQMMALNEIVNILATSPFLHQNDYLFNILNGLREELKKLL